jgi:hypothetical protein
MFAFPLTHPGMSEAELVNRIHEEIEELLPFERQFLVRDHRGTFQQVVPRQEREGVIKVVITDNRARFGLMNEIFAEKREELVK